MDMQAQKVISALKAGRTALSWSQDELSKRSGIALITIARMEAGRVSPRLSTVGRLKQTLEQEGVRIIDDAPQGGFTLLVEGRALIQHPHSRPSQTEENRTVVSKQK